MRIMEIKVYPFEELSEKVKQKVLLHMGDINVDHEWWDSTYEDAENIGLKISEFDLDRRSFVKGKFTEDAESVANNIIKEHGETCSTYTTAKDYLISLKELRIEWGKAFPNDPDDLDTEDIDTEFLKSLCEDYRIMLQKEYEYLLSDEAIKETIKANEYEFTENGKMM